MNSGPTSRPWRIINAEALRDWAEEAATIADTDTVKHRLAALEFIRDFVGSDPDFGDHIDVHTRRAREPVSDALVVWTFHPDGGTVEIIVPPC